MDVETPLSRIPGGWSTFGRGRPADSWTNTSRNLGMDKLGTQRFFQILGSSHRPTTERWVCLASASKKNSLGRRQFHDFITNALTTTPRALKKPFKTSAIAAVPGAANPGHHNHGFSRKSQCPICPKIFELMKLIRLATIPFACTVDITTWEHITVPFQPTNRIVPTDAYVWLCDHVLSLEIPWYSRGLLRLVFSEASCVHCFLKFRRINEIIVKRKRC